MAIIKLFHLIFLFVWIGNLLALTRLLGYLPHEPEETQKRLARIYRRMYLFVDLPAMVLALGLGIYLFSLSNVNWHMGWFHMKLTFSFLLLICDFTCGRSVLRLGKELPRKSFKYKCLHAVTSLILIGVLSSIYLVRNKEAEIRERILSQNEKLR